ncbi:O-antigen ligase family protein [Mesorhizobium sp.]|uniref:O-antigen ligase family protein n=1 Tax=Mesorhizobium sp. TaxID=1871066 RepID=UPI000FE69C74|nr:O-antigen ligase family protein [Mesorhizobium sp.]RWO52433.1 MAG: hypothetical protein EOS13_14675 [Mesorhizobium sp.]
MNNHLARFSRRHLQTEQEAPAALRLPLILFLAFYVGGMFHIFKSGLPQPADFIVFALVPLVARKVSNLVPVTFINCAVGLLGWVLLVNVVTYAGYEDRKLLFATVFYLFNFIVFLITLAMALDKPREFFSWLRIAVFASVSLQLLFTLFVSSGLRKAGTFDNPNQLGYWAVLNIACLGYSLGGKRLAAPDVAALTALVFLAASSLSRAAIVAAVAGCAAILVIQGCSRRLLNAGVVAVLCSLPILLSSGIIGTYLQRLEVVSSWEQRLDELQGRNIDEYSTRGYERIENNFEYIFFGAGEGAYERFVDTGPALELHSTFASILMSYGLVGVVLFLLLIMQVFKGTLWRHTLYFLPAVLYGLTHNGIRFSWLWVVLGCIAAQGVILGGLRKQRSGL